MSEKGNGIDAKKAVEFINRIENVESEMASEQGKYMKLCKELRSDIKDIIGEAKAAGIPGKALKAMLKRRDLERKKQDLEDGLDIDESAAYEQMVEKLGDFAGTALGKAAIDKAKPQTEQPSKH